MQNIPALITTTAHHPARFSTERGAEKMPYSDLSSGCTDDQFLSMLIAYRGSGGLARDGELLALSGRRHGPDAYMLACLIADQQVIGFDWQSRIWFPIFQFNLRDMTRPPALRQVLAELTPVYDAWKLVSWFARPNAWLDGRVPAEVLQPDPAAVLKAAQADRFIAKN